MDADWFRAFPIKPAEDAVDAICESWRILTQRRLPHFCAELKEPALTKALKAYVEHVVARERGLLGMWAAEGVIHEIDPATAELKEERRTDIVYGWNDNTRSIQLVFEFKKLSRLKKDRNHYLRENGLGRFVTGIYSRHQPVAAMVGMLVDPESACVPPLRSALSESATAATLRLKPAPSGEPFTRPSALFTTADFDTEHERDPSLAPPHGTIRIAHLFLQFGYLTSTHPPSSAPG